LFFSPNQAEQTLGGKCPAEKGRAVPAARRGIRGLGMKGDTWGKNQFRKKRRDLAQKALESGSGGKKRGGTLTC